MIIVIADDFTGAAEIAGAGLKYNLNCKILINTQIYECENLDLVVISTDTRTMSEIESYDFIYKLTQKVKNTKHSFIYKKVDSILRGNVYHEIKAIMAAYPFSKTILVPANPTLNRIIKDGNYLINGQYIHQTSFVNDPDFLARSSSVIEMLKAQNKNDVIILKPNQIYENLKEPHIIVGESTSTEDLKLWAEKIDPKTLPAGGVEFFKIIIQNLNLHRSSQNVVTENSEILKGNTLFICGSAISQSKVLHEILSKFNMQVFTLPDDVFYDTDNLNLKFQEWFESIKHYLELYEIAVVSVSNKPIIKNKNFTKKLRQKLVNLALKIFAEVKIDELVIEGGSTAHAILQNLGFKCFNPISELSPGVIRMKPKDSNLYVIVKPGSYMWPENLLRSLYFKLKKL